jgi:CheY-like chemotaxis protein
MLSPTILLRQPTILVVDDEEPLRRYMSRVIEGGDYRCSSSPVTTRAPICRVPYSESRSSVET